VARRKFAMLKEFLQHVGIEPERVHFSWVSASEGARFAILIAVPCTGVIDAAGVARSVQPDEIIAAEENDGMLLIKSDAGTTRKLKRTEALAEACRLCTHRTASVYDIAVGEPPETECVAASDDRFRQFTSKPGSERWKLFCREVSKCTLCKACRSACPNCYCKTCFADQTRPNWAGTGDQLRDVMLFHLGRIFHQAGRCVDCGACVRACNMGVDLRMFTYKLVADAKELFDCTAGVDLEQPPPLAAFSAGDPERFITEPE